MRPGRLTLGCLLFLAVFSATLWPRILVVRRWLKSQIAGFLLYSSTCRKSAKKYLDGDCNVEPGSAKSNTWILEPPQIPPFCQAFSQDITNPQCLAVIPTSYPSSLINKSFDSRPKTASVISRLGRFRFSSGTKIFPSLNASSRSNWKCQPCLSNEVTKFAQTAAQLSVNSNTDFLVPSPFQTSYSTRDSWIMEVETKPRRLTPGHVLPQKLSLNTATCLKSCGKSLTSHRPNAMLYPMDCFAPPSEVKISTTQLDSRDILQTHELKNNCIKPIYRTPKTPLTKYRSYSTISCLSSSSCSSCSSCSFPSPSSESSARRSPAEQSFADSPLTSTVDSLDHHPSFLAGIVSSSSSSTSSPTLSSHAFLASRIEYGGRDFLSCGNTTGYRRGKRKFSHNNDLKKK
ncbi:unnamed protein product [Protopolystoma xenopodis]|uniref:Uncharacterized protein n=1 Tax=Protopolystoma xenopodis TaxID=117903 RepID=A0A3S4ZBI6_9PLAT|nr:unnamed protein product [Protopolystoma xenopodis]